jgi:hypothetical protein
MFLNMASQIENSTCSQFSTQLTNYVLDKKFILNANTIKNIQTDRETLFPKKVNSKNKIINDAGCINYLNKAVRELNLMYIESADKVFKEKN